VENALRIFIVFDIKFYEISERKAFGSLKIFKRPQPKLQFFIEEFWYLRCNRPGSGFTIVKGPKDNQKQFRRKHLTLNTLMWKPAVFLGGKYTKLSKKKTHRELVDIYFVQCLCLHSGCFIQQKSLKLMMRKGRLYRSRMQHLMVFLFSYRWWFTEIMN
jgi:hypothetical protein